MSTERRIESKTALKYAGILLDIEGTIAPTAFVYDVLFPYAREAIPGFLARHWEDEEVRAARRAVAMDAQTALGSTIPKSPHGRFDVGGVLESAEGMVAHLRDLMDRDAKSTGLKAVQGLVWREGYQAERLKAALFADVPPALRTWHVAGHDIRIYSSGSILAQKLFLAHTEFGDMTGLIRDYFDTTTGPKQTAESYCKIAAAMALPPPEILFISDAPAELDAAAEAGLATRLAMRPGNKPVDDRRHVRIGSFAELHL